MSDAYLGSAIDRALDLYPIREARRCDTRTGIDISSAFADVLWSDHVPQGFNVTSSLGDRVSMGLYPILGGHERTMAHLEGFEPPTPSSEDWCSIR